MVRAMLLCFNVLPIYVSTCLDLQAIDEKTRYVRRSGDEFAIECEFKVERGESGWSIVSVTERGDTKLTVTARYDAGNLLTGAEVTLAKGGSKKTALVEVAGSKAKVTRSGQQPQEFDLRSSVIVTSAPDWTDTFLLCQRYDRQQGGKQQFAGLWIHPEEPAQRLTFTIERLGVESLERDGKTIELDRFEIRLRGNSPYVAWADSMGRMLKLSPLPFKADSMSGLVLQGYEKSTATLRPSP